MKRKERYIAVLAFLVHGGALHAYADYPKLVERDGGYVIASPRVASLDEMKCTGA